MNENLAPYKQSADGHPVDSYIPGDGKQLVDLTELYADTEQDKATVMVSGIEAMNLGKISRRLAVQLKLQGAHSYDPFASERNARAGQESFFTAIRDGFKNFIENIIKYIRMALDWVINTVKSIFGFRKSTRINQAVNDSLDEMKEEFKTSLTGIGFPANEYNLEKFIGSMPENVSRLGQVTLLKTKLASDEEAIKGLQEALPLLQKAISRLNSSSERASSAAKQLKRVIGEEYKHMYARRNSQGVPPIAPQDSPEANRVLKACAEVGVCLDTTALSNDMREVYEALYNITFTNEELTEGFNKVRERVRATLHTEQLKIKTQDVSGLLTLIQYLNQRYIDISKNEVDFSKIDFRQLGNVINRDDMEKVKYIAQSVGNDALLATYQETAADVRNFSQFCFLVSESLLIVDRQVANLCNWHNRANQYYYAGVLNDVETIAKVNVEARAAGHNPQADIAGYPTHKIVFVNGEDAQTFTEKLAAGMKFSVDANFGGAKTSLNNFAKQTGWGGGLK